MRKLLKNEFLPLSIAALAAFVAVPITGQDAPPKSQSRTIALDFKGGTLADYVKAVRAAGTDVNVWVSELASQVELPAVTLRDCSVRSALEAASSVVVEGFGVDTKMLVDGHGTPVYVVRIRPTGSRRPARSPQMDVRVFSLRNLITPMPGDPASPKLVLDADTILTAVETGLGVQDAKNPAKVRYHADSSLLFVRGDTSQLGLVQAMLSSIENDIVHRRNEYRRSVATTKATVASGAPAGKAKAKR